MIKKGAEKNLKYKYCTTEIERMLTVNTKLIPVIIGATGTISKSLRQFLSNVPGKHEIKALHKTAILCTAHTLTAGSATVKVQNMFNMGNNMTCSTDCKYRTATTLYMYHRNVVCFRYIIVSTVRKDGRNNNNNTVILPLFI